MKCLIIDKVYAGIAEELSKYMEVKTAENLPSTKDQLLAEIGDVDVLIMRVVRRSIRRSSTLLRTEGYRRLLRWSEPH